MDQASLARRAFVSRDTVADFEAPIRHPSETNLAAIRTALEKAGAAFRKGGIGVRLRKKA
jgi:hypothetical protein